MSAASRNAAIDLAMREPVPEHVAAHALPWTRSMEQFDVIFWRPFAAPQPRHLAESL